MNKAQKKQLQTVRDALVDLRNLIEEVTDEEKAVFDNTPEENFRGTDRYEQCESEIIALEEAMDYIESARNELYSVINEVGL